jgi:hypothetical protein
MYKTEREAIVTDKKQDAEPRAKGWRWGPFKYLHYSEFRNLEFSLLGFYVDVDLHWPTHITLNLNNLTIGVDSFGGGKYTAWIPVPVFHIGLHAPGLELAVGFHLDYRGKAKS